MLSNGTIKRMVSTWKSEQQRKNDNVYTFYVDPFVSKFQLREALEKIFDVKIEKISSLREKPVFRNSRRNIRTKLRKKIFVKLKEGYKIGMGSGESEPSIGVRDSITNDPK